MKIKNYLWIVLLPVLFGSCSDNDSIGSNLESGQGGSMARFTIVGDHLFTVDQTNLKVFDLDQVWYPRYAADVSVGIDVETISPFGDKLFLGTSSGMYIYDIQDPENPSQVSFYEHVVSCDPVVSDGEYAYVTLNNLSESCWRAVNELQIVSLEDMSNPNLVAQYEMTNPQGLAIKNDILWVCDNGLRIFDVTEKNNIKELYHFTDLEAYDIIRDEDRALVIGESGFVQYKIEVDTIRKLSEIKVGL